MATQQSPRLITRQYSVEQVQQTFTDDHEVETLCIDRELYLDSLENRFKEAELLDDGESLENPFGEIAFQDPLVFSEEGKSTAQPSKDIEQDGACDSKVHRDSIDARLQYTRSNSTQEPGRAWTKQPGYNHAVVPYIIAIQVPGDPRNEEKISKIIKQGIEKFNEQLATAAREANEQEMYLEWVQRKYNEEDYVEFVYGDKRSCSKVGRIGGKQELLIAEWAGPTTVLHEMGHAIGLLHEHCRPDRDNFIKISSNPEKTLPTNYDIKADSISNQPYDYYSIMHYPECSRLQDSEYTITVRNNKVDAKLLGRINKFSPCDLKAIKFLYGPLVCTYDVLDTTCFLCTKIYRCIDCWSTAHVSPCCYYCRKAHHGDHDVIPEESNTATWHKCVCGESKHGRMCTGKLEHKELLQPLYHCQQCFSSQDKTVCYPCHETCHKGHPTTASRSCHGICSCNLCS